MSTAPHKVVSDENWSQLMTLASGYLALEEGDVQAAMGRAIAAHAQLIRALKAGRITADLPEGRVTMFVPESGGVALRTERIEGTAADLRREAVDLASAPTLVESPAVDEVPVLPGMAPVPPFTDTADDPTTEVTMNARETNS